MLQNVKFFRHFNFLVLYDEYSESDISSQINSICALSAFVNRCNETLNNMCSQMFAIFNKKIINLSKYIHIF